MAAKVYWGLNSVNSGDDHPGNPTLILIGDSWFWYPFNNLAHELASQLSFNHVLLVLGNNGAEAQEWSTKYRKQIDLAFKWYAEGAQGLLLSGGGNDVAGPEDFDPLIEDNCSGKRTVESCYSPLQPGSLLGKIRGSYEDVIAKFRKYNGTAPFFTHNYEKAWPTGDGLFGPAKWLKVPMERARVPEKLRHPLFVDLIAQLRNAQLDIAKATQGPGKFIPIETAGTLPDDEDVWANELHLKPAAFKKMVKAAWIPVLKQEGIA